MNLDSEVFFCQFLGRRLKIRWGRPQARSTEEEKKELEPVSNIPNRKQMFIIFNFDFTLFVYPKCCLGCNIPYTLLTFLACPVPTFFDDEESGASGSGANAGPSAAKRQRFENIPMPPLPPTGTYAPPAKMIVPEVRSSSVFLH